MEEEAVDPGPWFDRVERSGDGTTDSSELYVVKPKKKTCALCELWFCTDNLTGMTSLKGVLTRKASFGDEDAARRLKDPRTTASRLYSGVPLCSFCAQQTVANAIQKDKTLSFTPQKDTTLLLTPKKDTTLLLF